uniref:Signal transduction histidine kinase dimerisation/phosphoacceptor domain-containing protein n=1 Tax=Romanomermis culicivorax TaxID=13658 RepID=A0A915J6J2_ROMCU
MVIFVRTFFGQLALDGCIWRQNRLILGQLIGNLSHEILTPRLNILLLLMKRHETNWKDRAIDNLDVFKSVLQANFSTFFKEKFWLPKFQFGP